MDEFVYDKLLKLDSKVEHSTIRKRKATENANKTLTITVDKGPIKYFADLVKEDKLQRLDEDNDLVSIQIEQTDSTASEGFMWSSILLIINLEKVDNKLFFEARIGGEYKDEFGDEIEMTDLMNKSCRKCDDVISATKSLAIMLDDVEDKYLGPTKARSTILDLIDSFAV